MKEVKHKSVDTGVFYIVKSCGRLPKNKKPMSRETDRLLPQQTDLTIKLINLIKLSL